MGKSRNYTPIGGTVETSAGNGQTIITSYGRDNSETSDRSMSMKGSKGFGGGTEDLSHSLKGATANQSGD